MSCTYGCSQQDVDQLCINCGDKKKHHSTVHPHICLGKYANSDQSPSKSCGCPGFKAKESSNGN